MKSAAALPNGSMYTGIPMATHSPAAAPTCARRPASALPRLVHRARRRRAGAQARGGAPPPPPSLLFPLPISLLYTPARGGAHRRDPQDEPGAAGLEEPPKVREHLVRGEGGTRRVHLVRRGGGGRSRSSCRGGARARAAGGCGGGGRAGPRGAGGRAGGRTMTVRVRRAERTTTKSHGGMRRMYCAPRAQARRAQRVRARGARGREGGACLGEGGEDDAERDARDDREREQSDERALQPANVRADAEPPEGAAVRGRGDDKEGRRDEEQQVREVRARCHEVVVVHRHLPPRGVRGRGGRGGRAGRGGAGGTLKKAGRTT